MLYLYCPFSSYCSTAKIHQTTCLGISVFIKTKAANYIRGKHLIDRSDKLNAFIDFCECHFGLCDVGVMTGSSWLRIVTGGRHL
jgi:hypothetical protein